MCSYMFIIMSLTVSNLLRSAVFTLDMVTTRWTHCHLSPWDITHGLGILPQQAEIGVKTHVSTDSGSSVGVFLFPFFKYVHCISSDSSDLPDMTAEYIP